MTELRKVTQYELDWALGLHKQYTENSSSNFDKKMRFAYCDLSGLDFKEMDLEYCEIINCDLSNANLFNVSLRHANLHGTNLNNANLHGTNLDWVDLRDVNAIGANFEGADSSCVFLDGERAIKALMMWSKENVPN